jgi:hypothetical protein
MNKFVTDKIHTIKSDITLFNPIQMKDWILWKYWWGIEQNEWKLYNEITIYENDWKHYAKNKYWVNVFLTKWLNIWTRNFYFKNIDWKHVLVAEQEGVNYYFLENWDQYIPENKIDHFIELTKNTIIWIKPYFS